MKLDEVRKQYNDGLLLKGEAVQLVESFGESRAFAERFLDGFAEVNRVKAGAARSNLLVLPRQ